MKYLVVDSDIVTAQLGINIVDFIYCKWPDKATMETHGPALEEIVKIISPIGSLYIECDQPRTSKVRAALNKHFGHGPRNEIVLMSDKPEQRAPDRWTITTKRVLYYTKTDEYVFVSDMLRPYHEPTTREKVPVGAGYTDVWHEIGTVLSPAVRAMAVSSYPSSLVVDPWGDGLALTAALRLRRRCIVFAPSKEVRTNLRLQIDMHEASLS